jgi:manganese-dependent inorganic pyrophosphatase
MKSKVYLENMVMTKDDVVFFRTDEFVEDAKEIMAKTRFRSYPILDSNNKF